MNKFFSESNVYIFTWMIYMLQGVLYETGSVYSQALFVFILLMSFRCVYELLHFYRIPKFLKYSGMFAFILFIYGFVYFITGKTYKIQDQDAEIQSFSYIKQILCSFLPIFSCYYYSLRGKISINQLKSWSIIFICVAIAVYYKNYYMNLAMAVLNGSDRVEFVNNSGYMFVSIIPLLLIWKDKKIVQHILLLICCAFVLVSMKRGAILCAIPCVYLFMKKSIKYASLREKRIIVMFTVIIIVAVLYLINYMEANSELFMDRVLATKEGQVSRRDIIYLELLNASYNRNLFYMLLGEGANATLLHTQNFAHNDWLELLIDTGLFGVILYIGYWVNFNKLRLRSRGLDIENSAITIYFIFFLLRTFFSMSYSDIPIFASIPLGYFIYNIYSFSNLKNKLVYVKDKNFFRTV